MSRRSLIIVLALAGLVVAGGFVGVVLATSGGDDKLTVYTARSHYGEEKPFKTFAGDEDVNLTLFGGSASELYERLKSEGANTKADALITVDAANLYRAEAAGLLAENRDPEVEKHVPANLRDPKGRWYGLTVRARTIMRSTDRVKPDARDHLRRPGRPALEGQAVPALGHQRVQHLVRRRPDRQGRGGQDQGDAASAGWPTSRRSWARTPTC